MYSRRINQKQSRLPGFVLVLCFSCFSWGDDFQKDQPKLLPELQVLHLLTQSLNDITESQDIDFRIIPITSQSIKILKSQTFLSDSAPKRKSSLPSLSTDSTLINPVDLTAFGYSDGILNSSQNKETSQGLLPIPQARVAPYSNGSSFQASSFSLPTDSAPLTSNSIIEPDVLTQFTPKIARFGKDRYDSDLFSKNSQNTAPSAELNLGPAPEPENISNEAKEDLAAKSDETPEQKKLKQKKEDFKKTMLEFAERTEDVEAFRLVDYYDLKNIFKENEGVLSKFDDDEIDLRFVANVQTVYDRFGPRDSTQGKRAFENFLKRMQPVVEFQSYRNSFKAEKRKKARHQPN